MHIPFDNSYSRLPERFYTRLNPTPVSNPGLIRLNRQLALELGLDLEFLTSEDGVATMAGNHVPEGAEPLAQAYAGHQFGGWSPQLGDGRAILLGEVEGQNGRRDIQLKGSGPTPFSRMGDGRAWLGPVLREYIVSEAMFALGIPTTRALAAVTTGDIVLRETPLPGAVLTRVASSHIRVGTFQYFVARQDVDALQTLSDHALARHYPEGLEADRPALALLEAVIARQAKLIADWMSVGFIHGVMNTDNMSVAGETIDYGPCAFMDIYHPDTVFSSIDQQGRYAYKNQPTLAHWNLAQLASSLVPLIDADKDRAIELATGALDGFPALYQAAWAKAFRVKLGLSTEEEDDIPLAMDLLDRMAAEKMDFTNTFAALGTADATLAPLTDWLEAWHTRRAREPETEPVNPQIIARNHQVQRAIDAGVSGDFAVFEALTDALATPFDGDADLSYRQPPEPEEEVLQTFCGT